MPENIINEYFAEYEKPDISTNRKSILKNKIEESLFNITFPKIRLDKKGNDISADHVEKIKGYRLKRWEIREQCGMACMQAVGDALKYYKGEINFFDKYLIGCYNQKLLDLCRCNQENDKYGAVGFHAGDTNSEKDSTYVRTTFRMILKEKNKIEKENENRKISNSELADEIGKRLKITQKTVMQYLRITATCSTEVELDKETNEEKNILDVDAGILRNSCEKNENPEWLCADEIIYRIKKVNETWKKEDNSSLATCYSKFLTRDLIMDLDQSELMLNEKFIAELEKNDVIDKDMIKSYMNLNYRLPSKKEIAQSLGLKPITKEYDRFLQRVKKNYDDDIRT